MSESPAIELRTLEQYLFAILLRVIDEACGEGRGKLNSWQLAAYAVALRTLTAGGLVEIEGESHHDIVAKISPRGHALLRQLDDEELPTPPQRLYSNSRALMAMFVTAVISGEASYYTIKGVSFRFPFERAIFTLSIITAAMALGALLAEYLRHSKQSLWTER